jgi:hypothetical protein
MDTNNREIPNREIRNAKLAAISQESALFALNKAKSLVMTFWRGGSIATTMSVASFFEVPQKTIRGLVDTYRDELIADGLRLVTGSELQEVRRTLRLTSNAPNANIWTPRAILRLGMVLRDSLVAKQVRTVLLDQVERNPNPKQLGLDPDPWELTDEQAGQVLGAMFGGVDVAPKQSCQPPTIAAIAESVQIVMGMSRKEVAQATAEAIARTYPELEKTMDIAMKHFVER